ncbi:MAG: hypothetical protein CM1200mP27_05470 [Chloroflexota bacterium]|nr:MAG: hypothetical protein CM1200mP27_05470 [Chloroflexota bacterium]
MLLAVRKLDVEPGHLLLDFVHVKECPYTYDAIVKGDSRSYSIAAASNVAKVTRDKLWSKLMISIQVTILPSTRVSYQGSLYRLNELGPCPIHRRSFGQWRD